MRWKSPLLHHSYSPCSITDSDIYLLYLWWDDIPRESSGRHLLSERLNLLSSWLSPEFRCPVMEDSESCPEHQLHYLGYFANSQAWNHQVTLLQSQLAVSYGHQPSFQRKISYNFIFVFKTGCIHHSVSGSPVWLILYLWSRTNIIKIRDIFSRTFDKVWTHLPSPPHHSWEQHPGSNITHTSLQILPLPFSTTFQPTFARVCNFSPFRIDHSANVTLEKVLSQICICFLWVKEVVLRRCQHLCCLPVWSESSCWRHLMFVSFYSCQIHSGCKWVSPCILRVNLHVVLQLSTFDFITSITELSM